MLPWSDLGEHRPAVLLVAGATVIDALVVMFQSLAKEQQGEALVPGVADYGSRGSAPRAAGPRRAAIRA
jgi:hypothetical protein